MAVTTTVYVTGKVNEQAAKQYQIQVAKDYKNKTVTVDGKKWDISFVTNYIYKENFSISNLRAGQGENVLFFDNTFATTGAPRTHVNSPNNNGGVEEYLVNAPVVISHETGHFIGFVDRYTEVNANNVGFRQYLMEKYGKTPGGKAYQMIQFLNKNPNKVHGICLSDIGYEKNHMNNNSGDFTDEQIASLVNEALNAANGSSETEISGIFDSDSKAEPSPEQLQNAYETMDQRTNEAMEASDNQ